MGGKDESSLWDGIRDTVAGAAPLLGSLIGGKPGEMAGNLVADALGTDNSAEAIDNALKNDPEALAKLKTAELEHQTELRRLAVKREENRLEHDTANMRQVNETMRAEYKNDVYWRRAVGWAFAITVILFPTGIFISLWQDKLAVSDLSEVMTAMKEYWYAVIIVLGVAANHAGKRERISSGEKSEGALKGAINAIRGK